MNINLQNKTLILSILCHNGSLIRFCTWYSKIYCDRIRRSQVIYNLTQPPYEYMKSSIISMNDFLCLG
jgi:hypothetical protein